MTHVIFVWVDGLIAIHVTSILQKVFEICIVNNGESMMILGPKGKEMVFGLWGFCVCVCVHIVNHDGSFFNCEWVEGRCKDHGRDFEDIFLRLNYYATKLIGLGVKVEWQKILLLLLLFCKLCDGWSKDYRKRLHYKFMSL